MKIIERIYQRIIGNMYDEKVAIRYRILNLLIMVGGLFSVVACIFTVLENVGIPAVIACIGTSFVSFFCLVLSAKFKKYELAASLLMMVLNLVMFPLLFFTCGGLDSGMLLWLVMGFILVFLALRGPMFYIMYVLTIASFITVLHLSRIHPEWVMGRMEGSAMYFDIIMVLIMVGSCIGILFKFQNRLFEKQTEKLIENEARLQEAILEAEKASKAKGDFLANMSHEIRTPINAVIGMDEMILREAEDSEILRYADNIKSSSNTLLGIINDILDFSKIESGKMELIPAEYNTKEMLTDCFNAVYFRAKEKNLGYYFKVNPAIPSVLFGDEIRVRQIINNLLTNAVKYTQTGSVTTSFSVKPIDEDHMSLCIKVADTGMGISSEDKSKMFEAFQRIEEKKNRSVEGTGLGLSITKQLIDLMGGTLTVQSELGVGSVFLVEIPQKVVNKEPVGRVTISYLSEDMVKSEKYSESFRAPDAGILVVDDVDMNNKVILGLLKKTLLKIDTAHSGYECIEKVKQHQYDIILLDHMMPELDGIETLKLLQETPEFDTTTPVIALTANAVVGAKEMYLKAGFTGYLTKPVKSVELENMIKEYLPKEKVILPEAWK